MGQGITRQTIGLVIGLALFALTLFLPAPGDMPLAAWRVAGVAMLMASWWISEAVPLPATAMLPLVLFPLLGVTPLRQAAIPYADPIIFLFLGGFILSAAMLRWSLHKRIGLKTIAWIGTTPRLLIGGFLCATAFISMWVSNSATAMMMLPVAISVVTLFEGTRRADETSFRNLGVALLLAVAYGASIGGLGTLIGTPPNALLAAYMAREHGVEISFVSWMMLGVPVAIVLLGATWIVLCRRFPVSLSGHANAALAIEKEILNLGAMSPAEIRVAIVFVLTAAAWVTSPLLSPYIPGLNDTLIALAAALALFLIPSGMPGKGRILVWEDLRELPWGVLLLFGGGLSLADSMSSSGLANWLGDAMGLLRDFPVLLIVVAATVFMIFFTELTSNTAATATFVPIGAAVAIGIGLDPLALTIPLALAASCGFMLPVGTPPNAIVFATGRVTAGQMAATGFWLNIIGGLLIIAVCHMLAPLVLGG